MSHSLQIVLTHPPSAPEWAFAIGPRVSVSAARDSRVRLASDSSAPVTSAGGSAVGGDGASPLRSLHLLASDTDGASALLNAWIHSGHSPPVSFGWDRGANEVQVVTCGLTSGNFSLELAHHRTFPIAWDASATAVRDALEELPSVEFVRVTLHPGPSACSAEGTGASTMTTAEHSWIDDLMIRRDSDRVYVGGVQCG